MTSRIFAVGIRIVKIRDMEEAVGAGKDFHEGSEVDDSLNLAEVRLRHLRDRGELFDNLHRLSGRFLVGRCDSNRAIVFHIDLHLRPLDDAADHLATGADDVSDLRGRYPHREDSWCVGGDILARLGNRLCHLLQDEEPCLACLLQGFRHDGGRNARYLDVHLQSRESFGGAGDLEIHVPVMILGPRDVSQDGVVISFHDQTHRGGR